MSKIVVLPLILWAALLHAQMPALQRITIEDGLSQGMIFDLLQTRDSSPRGLGGFLWVATKDGLNRYDGYNFKVFSNDPFNPYSIAENTVTALFEDSRGWLWVGLETKGLDVYDPRTGRFHHFPLSFGDSKQFDGTNVVKIIETRDGTIWLIKRNGSLLNIPIPPTWKTNLPTKPDLQQETQVKTVPLPFVSNSGPSVAEPLIDLSLRLNGEIWVTSFLAQYAVDPTTFACHRIHEKLLAPIITHAAAGEEAYGGDFWFRWENQQTFANELRRIRNGQLTIFPFSNASWKWPRLSSGKKGSVWFSLNNQMWELSPGEDIDFSKPDLLLDQDPNCQITDRNGNMWVGTLGYGLRKINPVQTHFHTGAAGTSIRMIWANGGQYFTRAHFFDIRQYDPQTGKVAEKSAFPDAPTRQINLAFEPSGTAWLLCSESDYATSMLRRYAPGSFASATGVYGFDAGLNLFDPMLRASDGRLWIAANNGRLVRFDPATEQFDYFDFGHLFGENINALRAIALAEDGNGILWVGTQMGLVKCTPKPQGFDFQIIQADANNRRGLNNNSIACILPDPADPGNILWIGTKGGGINRMDLRTGGCRHITTADGLLNNVVYGILPGNTPLAGGQGGGEFWCSTNRGLAKIVQRTDDAFDITTFTAALGLQDNEFNTYAFCKSDKGELLFGGVNGLNRFFPEELMLDTTPPPVFIVGLEINHKKADFSSPGSPLAQPLETLQELRLNHDQNNLSFEFAALDFTDPSKNRYRYRLVGLDKDWVETGNQRFAHFNHLSPGRYEFRVQGSNGESAWADAANPIVVVVMPPWWRSKMAYLCYFLLLAWAGWRAYQFQIQRVKEREQLAFEQRETERIRALEQVKTNFFSNVTHEFRTPLTLIIEPLRQLLKNPDDPDRSEKIRLAEKNSRRLLGLVNQLLDMAKIEGGSMSLDLRRGDFAQTVRGVFESFLHLAEKQGVKLTISAPSDIPLFEFDPGKVELVLNNLISNALKFTPEGGRVAIGMRDEGRGMKNSAASSLIPHPSSLFVSVTDTGIGIPGKELDRIFDRFYQVDGSHTRAGEGTGIGLALSKELAELMGGGISVKSEVGKGSTFTFWLPVQAVADVAVTEMPVSAAPEILKQKTPNRHSTTDGERPVALVVEDNAELRMFIKQSIGEAWQVVEASNGEEGVKRAIELLPDLVISDLMMPVKDGYALCYELKTNELTAHIPVILLTAKSAVEAKLKGLRTGADDYLTKPFNTDELLARMENLVELRRKLRERYGSKPFGEAMQSNEDLSPPDQEFLKKFTLLLESHLADETLGVEAFSQKMLISRSQLHRKLKAITNRSATDFIKDYRLERAHAMLKNREGMVSEIALRVGFGNEKYFSTVFKEKFGVSPSQVT